MNLPPLPSRLLPPPIYTLHTSSRFPLLIPNLPADSPLPPFTAMRDTAELRLLDSLLRSAASVPLTHLLAAVLFVFLYNFFEIHHLRRGSLGDPVSLTFHPSSDLFHSVAARCSFLRSRFQANIPLRHLRLIRFHYVNVTEEGLVVASGSKINKGKGNASCERLPTTSKATNICMGHDQAEEEDKARSSKQSLVGDAGPSSDQPQEKESDMN